MNSMSTTQLLSNFLAALLPIWNVMVAFIALLGILLVGFGLYSAGRMYSPNSKVGKSGVIAGVIVGSLMVNISFFLNFMSYTVFNKASSSGISYTSSQTGAMGLYLEVAMGIIAIVGLWSLTRGLYLIKDVGEDKRNLWHGVTHILGGIMAINMSAVFLLIGATVGGVVQTLTRLVTG